MYICKYYINKLDIIIKVDDIQIWSNTEGDSKLGANALKSNDSFRVISYVKCEFLFIYLLAKLFLTGIFK